MALHIKTRTVKGVAIADCSGRIVFGEETTLLREQVKRLLAESPVVVLNLSEVRDIDSGGVGTLVGLFTSARGRGGDVKLCKLSPKAAEVLRLTKLLGIIEAYEREEDAIAACGKPPRAAAS